MVIAPSFADIFYGNAFNSQLLPIILDEAQIAALFTLVSASPGIAFSVDVEQQTLQAGDTRYTFTLDPFRRHCLIHGLDSIGLTLRHASAIDDYEARRPAFLR